MDQPEERAVHCTGCSRLITLADDAGEGSIVDCPFCGTKNRLKLMTVFVAEQVEEA